MDESTSRAQTPTCGHPDRAHVSRGMCRACYEAYRRKKRKDQEQAHSTRATPDGAPGDAPKSVTRTNASGELEKVVPGLGDEDRVEFVAIMWRWIRDLEAAKNMKCWLDDNMTIRDYKTEARLQEVASALAQKAATILGRAFVGEKSDGDKTIQPLAIAGLDLSGWTVAPAAPRPPSLVEAVSLDDALSATVDGGEGLD